MDILERIWELISSFFTGITVAIERMITKVFGASNTRDVAKLRQEIVAINELEPRFQAMSDTELREQTDIFRRRLAAGETLDDILPEAFAVCREAGRRFIGLRHYDTQFIGGMVLHRGAIAEMVTGEGKTLVATLPAYLNALEGKGVHVVTVNDYLARRDMEWMGPIYMGLGLTVGNIQSGMSTSERQKSYACDITYGTNNEFGFDYLRDNMRPAARGDNRFPKEMQQSQGELHYAIVDEVDNILIDEARTPLIISGQAHGDVRKYPEADRIARLLQEGEHFEVKEKEHTVHLTDAGIRAAEKFAGVESFYTAGNMEWPHLLDNALKAHHLYKRDVNYVVEQGEVVIVDEFTGRKMPGRQWSDGLHQAVEAKERVPIKEETQTLATITLQNFFKLYKKISGMTGTAMTEATEFQKIYSLPVIAIPTNREMQRINFPDVVYRSEREKFSAIVEEVERMHRWDTLYLEKDATVLGKIIKESADEVTILPKGSSPKEAPQVVPMSRIKKIDRHGRPILIGTVSIEKSERISEQLSRHGIPHEVLNAKHHKREAEIVAQAGRRNAVTIATNMAGRGTDIVLGGNPETMAWAQLQDKYATRLDVPQEEWNALVHEIETRENMKPEGRDVAAMGGLHVMGTERHEARRIDLQLRGRCGRQGDPGSSRFYISLEDELMRKFAGPWVQAMLSRLGMQEGDAIESPMLTRRIEAAQRKVEERNFETRKHLLEYDEVMDEQRKRVYGFRQAILGGANCKDKVLEMIDEQITQQVENFMSKDYGAQCFASWASNLFSVELKPQMFRGCDYATGVNVAKDEADRLIESMVIDAVDENLPEGEEESEWNWNALTNFANTRWKLNLKDRDLKQVERPDLPDFLMEKARAFVVNQDCSEGREFLEPGFSAKVTCAWVRHQFGVEMDEASLQGKETSAVMKEVRKHVHQAYDEREAVYPVLAGLSRFSRKDASGGYRLDRQGFVTWARDRFGAQLAESELENKQRPEIVALLVDESRKAQGQANALVAEIDQQLSRVYGPASNQQSAIAATGGNGALDSLAQWMKTDLRCELPPSEIAPLKKEELQKRLNGVVEDRYRPEMRRMERQLILQILDGAWKDHLLAMDHLKSNVGLRVYAQVDAKVEYKREGMKTYHVMWRSVGERVTNLIFRMEQLEDRFLGSTFVETAAIHESPPKATPLETKPAASSEAAADSSNKVDPNAKIEPIRNFKERVGRNDPCPCGSGKKYKQCHGRFGGNVV